MENIELNIKKIKFTNRPQAIPYFYRLTYRMSITCLIIKLNNIKNSSCSLSKIQIITNALYSDEAFKLLVDGISDKDHSKIIIRYDPTVNTTINFLLSERLIELKSLNTNKYLLTSKGEKFVEELLADTEVLTEEKKSLKKISTKLTDTLIKNIYKD